MLLLGVLIKVSQLVLCAGICLADSTPLMACRAHRIWQHRVLADVAGRGRAPWDGSTGSNSTSYATRGASCPSLCSRRKSDALAKYPATSPQKRLSNTVQTVIVMPSTPACACPYAPIVIFIAMPFTFRSVSIPGQSWRPRDNHMKKAHAISCMWSKRLRKVRLGDTTSLRRTSIAMVASLDPINTLTGLAF